jgi:hypothetical protein
MMYVVVIVVLLLGRFHILLPVPKAILILVCLNNIQPHACIVKVFIINFYRINY